MSEEGGSLATKTEKVSHFFFLTMAEEGERVGWEKARSLLPSRHSAFSATDGNYRLASAFFTQ